MASDMLRTSPGLQGINPQAQGFHSATCPCMNYDHTFPRQLLWTYFLLTLDRHLLFHLVSSSSDVQVALDIKFFVSQYNLLGWDLSQAHALSDY